MNTALQIMNEVKAVGGTIKLLPPDRLHVSAPRSLVERIKAHKRDILAALLSTPTVASLIAPDAFAERASIIEANGMPHEWAVTFAKLDTMPRPASIKPERWQQIVDDAGRFLGAWGRQAAALGWNAVECFHPLRGFVSLIEGDAVTAITATTAAITQNNLGRTKAMLCRLVALPNDPSPRWRVWSCLHD